MPGTWWGPGKAVPVCPDCDSEPTFVSSWTFRGLWGYIEVRTYECPAHGPIFITPELPIGAGPHQGRDTAPDAADRDSLIPARRKPSPTLDSGAIALPEPDSD